MNRTNQILKTSTFFAFLLMSLACGREEVKPYAPIESFPKDSNLESISEKRMMIIVAHDDDMCAMTGTTSILNKQGWNIRVLSFPKGKEREEAHRKACRGILDSVLFFDISINEFRDDTASKKYMAIPKERFHEIFEQQLVAPELIEKVNRFKPTVIFTLDNEMGGYGNPEHVFISQLVLDLAKADSISPQYIYQSVYTNHMENSIMERHSKRMMDWGFPGDEWEKAKQTYGVTGMPEPTVEITITSEAKEKMNYLKSYNKRERETMGFFIPAFEKYSAEEYFAIFDREFYRVLEKGEDF